MKKNHQHYQPKVVLAVLNYMIKQEIKMIRWGILGLGHIAKKFAQDIVSVHGAELYAVASRSSEKASSFANQFDVSVSYDSYDLLDHIAYQISLEYIIVDGNKFKPYKDVPFETIVKGDAKYLSIASIILMSK